MYLSLTIVGMPSENTLLGGGNFCLSSSSDRTFSMPACVATVRGLVLAQSTKMSSMLEPAAVEIMLVVRYLEPPAGCGGPNPPGFGTLSLIVGVNHLQIFFLRISFNIIRLPTEGTPMLTSNYGPLIIGSEA